MAKSQLKSCFVKDKNCSETYKRAHILSKAATLSLIKGKTKAGETVVHLGNFENNTYLPKEIGWKSASSEKCFCSKHDDEVFKAIENGNTIDENSEEQLFLYSFRSFAYTYYKKETELGQFQHLPDSTENLMKKDRENRSNKLPSKLDVHLRTYRFYHQAFTSALKSKKFDDFDYRGFKVPLKFPFASAGTLMAKIASKSSKQPFMVSYDGDSPVIKNPALTLTVLPLASNETIIILCAYKKDTNAIMNLERFIRLSLDEFLRAVTSLMLSSNKDNSFLNPKLWNYLKSNGLDKIIIEELNEERESDLLMSQPRISRINLFEPRFSCKNLEIE